MGEPVYTTFQISRFCSVDITTVMSWVQKGKLKAYKTPGGHRRILKNDLLEFLAAFQMPIPSELLAKGKKVLIVDDEQAVLKIISRSLRKISKDTQIETAEDGFVAGRKIENFLPDLVILDLFLPGLDGFEVCKNIRTSTNTRRVKILAISGYNQETNRKKILACGADDFLAKPFKPADLIKKISNLIPA